MGDDIHENCGVAAVFCRNGHAKDNKALYFLYRMLLSLQHRGQLSAGFTTYNLQRTQLIDTHKDLGTVNEVFKTSRPAKMRELLERYKGTKAIGHTRYATCGPDDKGCAQPFERHHGRMWKWFSFCFNGNIANYAKLKKELEDRAHYHLIQDMDTEVIMHYLSYQLRGKKRRDLVKVFNNISKVFDGSYNIAFLNAYGDVAVVRDPLGNRPLMYGYKDDSLFVASESVALQSIGVKNFKDLQPGEMILVEGDTVSVKQYAEPKRKAYCMFEWVYFSSVCSTWQERSVYLTRTNLGKNLAKLETQKMDKDYIVVPVPDTAKAAGDAFAFELGIPSREGLIRNRHVGRTFIESGKREEKIKDKFTVLREVVEGKKILLVDDSVVRGNTTKAIVKYLKEEGGAKEVHVRVACPPIRFPCFYGIDMSTVRELLVPEFVDPKFKGDLSQDVLNKIAKDLGADSLIYMTLPLLVQAIGLPSKDLCMACLNGEYPTPWGQKLCKIAIEHHHEGKQCTSCRTHEMAENPVYEDGEA